MSMSKISLRSYLDEHVEKTVFWLNSEHIKQSFGISYSVTVESHRHWLKTQSDTSLLAIYHESSYVGNIIYRVQSRHKKAYYEMYIGDQAFQGKGIGKIALSLFLEYAFGNLELNRVYLYTHSENIAAESLYQSVGFRKEGIERESVLDSNGIFKDQVMWAILRNDWFSGDNAN